MFGFEFDFIPFYWWVLGYAFCGSLTASLMYLIAEPIDLYQRDSAHLLPVAMFISLWLWPLIVVTMVYGFIMGVVDLMRNR